MSHQCAAQARTGAARSAGATARDRSHDVGLPRRRAIHALLRGVVHADSRRFHARARLRAPGEQSPHRVRPAFMGGAQRFLDPKLGTWRLATRE
jgi:hypothetical protein